LKLFHAQRGQKQSLTLLFYLIILYAILARILPRSYATLKTTVIRH